MEDIINLILRAIGGDTWAFGVLFVITMPIFVLVSLIIAGIKKVSGRD